MKRAAVFCKALFWAGCALALGGCDNKPSESHGAAVQVATADGPAPKPNELDQAARFDWQMNCQGCHHPNGEGNAVRGIPPLERLETFQRSTEGREFLIRVPGMARSALSDEELTVLANWMMTEFVSPDSKVRWQPYSIEEVADLRRRPITSGIVEYRASLVRQLERAR